MNHRALWGKTAAGDRYHPLLCHMLDVGAVAETLLLAPAARHIVRALGRLMGIDEVAVAPLTACLVALHDVAKASPSFERKSELHWHRVRAAGFEDAAMPQPRFDHALEACLVLRDVIERTDLLRVEGRRARKCLDAIAHGIAAHHGRFFPPGSRAEVPHDDRDLPEPWHAAWRDARLALAGEVRRVFMDDRPAVPGGPRNLSALCAFLSGFTVLCDWIGSDQDVFEPYDDGDLDLYPAMARARARRALDARRLLSYLPAPTDQPTFRDLFTFELRPLQRAVEPDALDLPAQALIVVEAPTGEGKTEAAFLLARRLAFAGEVDGFYFALPTMATSNQMFHRIRGDLGRQLGAGGEASLLLVHGLSEFSSELAELLEHAKHEGLEPDERVVADSWLLPRKRSLVTPYGVGTVDQAMLAALNVRFGSLRLFGLAGKVLVVDEVHAYDLYMSTILQQLLRWLGALGASVVLLSATLPRDRREELVTAFQGKPMEKAAAADVEPYPLITVVGGPNTTYEPRAVQVEAASPRTVWLERRRDGADAGIENARFLLDEIAGGGCVCWLCNTVGEAQECFQAVEQAVGERAGEEPPTLILFHARFPQAWRSEIEAKVVALFGPGGERRPHRAVLVATQVVEQSLDLDFDLMMTQLAPIDLLIQRAGRVYRHAREERVGRPRLVLLVPNGSDDGAPDFGRYGYVYQPHVLLRTIATLRDRDRIEVPTEIRLLIESVYDDSTPDQVLVEAGIAEATVVRAKRLVDRDRARMRDEAKLRLLQPPDEAGLFSANPALPFDEDAAEGEQWIAAQTRLGEPSVRAILLDEGHPLIARVTSRQPPRLATAELTELLDRSVTIANASLFRHVTNPGLADKVYPVDNVRGLKGRHLIVLTHGGYGWSDGGSRYRMVLSRKLGVQITREASG